MFLMSEVPLHRNGAAIRCRSRNLTLSLQTDLAVLKRTGVTNRHLPLRFTPRKPPEPTTESGPLRAVHLSHHKWPGKIHLTWTDIQPRGSYRSGALLSGELKAKAIKCFTGVLAHHQAARAEVTLLQNFSQLGDNFRR